MKRLYVGTQGGGVFKYEFYYDPKIRAMPFIPFLLLDN
jgi:hypothetical protein